jgi:hypothetical protein
MMALSNPPLPERHWNGEQWIYPQDIDDALNQALLVIDEYYNGDRAWAEAWLLKAHEANQEKPK